MQIARERGLRHAVAATRQLPAQFVLAGDRLRGDNIADRFVTRKFGHGYLCSVLYKYALLEEARQDELPGKTWARLFAFPFAGKIGI